MWYLYYKFEFSEDNIAQYLDKVVVENIQYIQKDLLYLDLSKK